MPKLNNIICKSVIIALLSFSNLSHASDETNNRDSFNSGYRLSDEEILHLQRVYRWEENHQNRAYQPESGPFSSSEIPTAVELEAFLRSRETVSGRGGLWIASRSHDNRGTITSFNNNPDTLDSTIAQITNEQALQLFLLEQSFVENIRTNGNVTIHIPASKLSEYVFGVTNAATHPNGEVSHVFSSLTPHTPASNVNEPEADYTQTVPFTIEAIEYDTKNSMVRLLLTGYQGGMRSPTSNLENAHSGASWISMSLSDALMYIMSSTGDFTLVMAPTDKPPYYNTNTHAAMRGLQDYFFGQQRTGYSLLSGVFGTDNNNQLAEFGYVDGYASRADGSLFTVPAGGVCGTTSAVHAAFMLALYTNHPEMLHTVEDTMIHHNHSNNQYQVAFGDRLFATKETVRDTTVYYPGTDARIRLPEGYTTELGIIRLAVPDSDQPIYILNPVFSHKD